ncbi:MAG: hypothetical protein EBZ74_11310, partial [Planctomycetia bacterium]|nr:hypothetical protein [Planctomycetia bacterium]
MGIVAHCPQGHRINVKDSFAGRKCLCPTCGVKFRIPAAGTDADGAGLPTARLLELDPAAVAALPRALPFEHEPPAATSAPAAAFAPAPAPAPAPVQPALHPALAERPDLQWCIAFPGGEPTEPLAAESMQAWLDSGEAEGSEVVWRSDWPEWRPA